MLASVDIGTCVVPEWAANSSKLCTLCCRGFSAVRRRHHCRRCGVLVCSACSQFRLRLQSGDAAPSERHCSRCARAIAGLSRSDDDRRLLQIRLTPSEEPPLLLGCLTSLNVLHAEACTLRSLPSESFDLLRCIQELHLRDNRLSELPHSAELPRLRHIDVSQNELEALPDWLWSHRAVVHLDASCNRLRRISERVAENEVL